MTSTTHNSAAPATMVRTVAAIDIGSNAIRMVIAELATDGSIEVLETLTRAVRLGQATFRRGRLTAQTMRTAVAILRDYRKLIDFYRVEQVRAVATSAVREANNADTFIDRVYVATGLDIEVIDTSEQSRLNLSALRRTVGDALDINKGTTLIADVGGGNTILTQLKKGEIAFSQSLQLGAIRLLETVGSAADTPERRVDDMRRQVSNTVKAAATALPIAKAGELVVLGGDARFAARHVGEETASPQLLMIRRVEFKELVRTLEQETSEGIAKEYGLSFAEAETLVPALLVFQEILELTKAPHLLVSQITMRDGLLLDLARSTTGQEDEALIHGVIHSAETIIEKYFADTKHANYVSETAARLFDEMQDQHGLGPRHRLLLRVAGLVHEVGGYVASRAHHKHSYYLIANSEIFGLTREETQIVAHVARYHRRGLPKPSHIEYMQMAREARMVVSKLAALLRIADALDRAHAQQLHDFSCERSSEELVIRVRGVADLTLERRAVKNKGDLFEDIYGLKVKVEEAPPGAGEERRARAFP